MIFFDVLHPYYIPQYLPVAKELKNRGEKVVFVIYHNKDQQQAAIKTIASEQLETIEVQNQEEALTLYLREKAEWIVFGNAFSAADQLKGVSRTALMQHGIGAKACYYTVSEADFDVRFVEGQYRQQRLQEMFPTKEFIDTGYAKLDPIINNEEKGLDLASVGLDPTKPTILYAPTYYPSSLELMPMNWPEAFSKYNILIKPHYFSFIKKSYHKQLNRLQHWNQFDNVYLANENELNLLPFMASADLLISDASSAIFEFAALDKPVIWCNFYKLRWSYRGIFHYRFERRMDKDLYRCADIAPQVDTYKILLETVQKQLATPKSYSEQRQKYTTELAGIVDGQCSQRIVNHLLNSF